MKRNMLEHQKKVIKNVSDNDETFNKEIAKSRKWLTNNDFEKLQKWLKSTFQKA